MEKIRKSFLAVVCIGILAFSIMSILSLILESTKPQRSTAKIFSHILEEERTMYTSLPDGYAASEKMYPILYVLDAEGETLFPKCVSTVKDLNAKEIVPSYAPKGFTNKLEILEGEGHVPAGSLARGLQYIFQR